MSRGKIQLLNFQLIAFLPQGSVFVSLHLSGERAAELTPLCGKEPSVCTFFSTILSKDTDPQSQGKTAVELLLEHATAKINLPRCPGISCKKPFLLLTQNTVTKLNAATGADSMPSKHCWSQMYPKQLNLLSLEILAGNSITINFPALALWDLESSLFSWSCKFLDLSAFFVFSPK